MLAPGATIAGRSRYNAIWPAVEAASLISVDVQPSTLSHCAATEAYGTAKITSLLVQLRELATAGGLQFKQRILELFIRLVAT